MKLGKFIAAAVGAVLLCATSANAAVVQPLDPQTGFTTNSSAPCDATSILHVDCIGMVTNIGGGLTPAKNDKAEGLSANKFFGYDTWMEVDKYDDGGSNGILNMTGFGTQSGTYSFTGMAGYVYTLVVKGSPGFSAYLLNGTSASMADWDTGGLRNGGGNQPNISHLTLYKAKGMSVVPLPAAGWLMLAGLGGLAALRRRK